MDLAAHIDRQLPALIDLRHRLHQIPELGDQELKTAELIRGELRRMGVGHVAGLQAVPTATIAWVGDSSKPCLALRADIDALPIVEKTGLAYASTHPGVMHACGHDGHAATLLGVAGTLESIESQLAVCVKLIFQPAEEGGAGARRLVEAGVLDGRIGPKVKAIFGLHGWPGLGLGTVSTRAGAIMAATDTFRAEFVGIGCHGAFPHLGRDPIVAASEAVVNLQQFVTRDLDPTEAAVITVGKFTAGTATNVIPERATIEGTARTLSAPARGQIREGIRRRCAGIASAAGCGLDFAWEEGYPPTINDAEMAGYVERVARDALGPQGYLPAARPSMGGEDFAYYLEQVPGCFFMVGVTPPDGTSHPLHSDRYDFPDAALPVGVRMFVELVRNFGR